MSARRAAKAGAARADNGVHRPGFECPWAESQCSACVQESAIHIAWQLTGKKRPWGDGLRHIPERCHSCKKG